MEGFIVVDYMDEYAGAIAEMRGWIDAGKLTQRTTVIDGFRKLPEALVKLFQGYNTGKLMVKTGRSSARACRSSASRQHSSGVLQASFRRGR